MFLRLMYWNHVLNTLVFAQSRFLHRATIALDKISSFGFWLFGIWKQLLVFLVSAELSIEMKDSTLIFLSMWICESFLITQVRKTWPIRMLKILNTKAIEAFLYASLESEGIRSRILASDLFFHRSKANFAEFEKRIALDARISNISGFCWTCLYSTNSSIRFSSFTSSEYSGKLKIIFVKQGLIKFFKLAKASPHLAFQATFLSALTCHLLRVLAASPDFWPLIFFINSTNAANFVLFLILTSEALTSCAILCCLSVNTI